MGLAPAKELAEKIGSPFVGLSRVVGSSSRNAEPRHRLRQRVGVDCSEGGIYLNGLAVEVGPHLLRSLLTELFDAARLLLLNNLLLGTLILFSLEVARLWWLSWVQLVLDLASHILRDAGGKG